MSTVHRARAPSRVNPANWIADLIVAVLVMSWWKRLCFVVALIGATGLAAHLFGGLASGLGMAWNRLPVSLTERAEIFARSWLAADKPGMTRFIRPTDEAKLWRWIAANPVPAKLAGGLPANYTIAVVAVDKDDMDGAAVKVRFGDAAALAKGAPARATSDAVILQIAWSYTGGHWLFMPEQTETAEQQAAASAAHSQVNSPRLTTAAPTRLGIAPDDGDNPAPVAPISRNVVIPSTVPPWQRAR